MERMSYHRSLLRSKKLVIFGIALIATLGPFFTTTVSAACCVCHDTDPTHVVNGQHACWYNQNASESACASLNTREGAGAPGTSISARCTIAPTDETGRCTLPAGQWRRAICGTIRASNSTVQEVASTPTRLEDAIGATTTEPITEQTRQFRSLKPILSIPIPGVTFDDATLANGKVTVPFLAQYIAGIFRFAIGAAALLASIMVVYGGFRYLLGSTLGDIKAGREVIQNAVIGLIVLLCSYVILRSINPAVVNLQPLQLEYSEPLLAPPGSSQAPAPGGGSGTITRGTTETPGQTAASGTPVRKLPEAVDGLTGSQFSLQLLGISDPTVGVTVLTAIKTGNFSQAASLTPRGSSPLSENAREQAIKTALIAGHYPQFLSTFIPVNVNAGSNTGTFFVTADVLAIGRDSDYLRIPMKPRTAQEIATHFNMLLPTQKMVVAMVRSGNFVHERLIGHDVYPQENGTRDHNFLYIRSNQEIQEQRNSHFVASRGYIGGKKDIVIKPGLSTPVPTSPDSACVLPSIRKTLRISIYGALNGSGGTVQDPTNIHSITYVDYSHGVHLVANEMVVNGQPRPVSEVLASPELAPLLNATPIPSPTYPLTGPTQVCEAP